MKLKLNEGNCSQSLIVMNTGNTPFVISQGNAYTKQDINLVWEFY